MREARIFLNHNALRHNLARVRDYAPHSQVLVMVKADAYGHGLAFAVEALTAADAFGVAFLAEARQVRALTHQPIVIIEGVFSQAEWHGNNLDIPLKDRVIEKTVLYDESKINFIKERVEIARKYLANLK